MTSFRRERSLARLVLLLLLMVPVATAQEVVHPLDDLIFVEADRQFEEFRREEDRAAEEALKMPDVRGVPADRAVSFIQSLDFRVQPLVKTIPSEGVPDLVVSQKPNPGQLLEDTQVVLYVSEVLENSRLKDKPPKRAESSSGVGESVGRLVRWVLFAFFQVGVATAWFFLSRSTERALGKERPNELSLFSGGAAPGSNQKN